jgi:hypothetical protein
LLDPDSMEAIARLQASESQFRGLDLGDDDLVRVELRLGELSALLTALDELRQWVSKTIAAETKKDPPRATMVDLYADPELRRMRVHSVALELFTRRNMSPSECVAQAESICQYLEFVYRGARAAEVANG